MTTPWRGASRGGSAVPAGSARGAGTEDPAPEGVAAPRVETSDLNLASFLRCRGFWFVDIKRERGRVIFVVGDSPDLHQAVLDYANDAAVAVRSFCNTLRDLKGLTR